VDRVKVRTLREQCISFRKIAEQLGYSLPNVVWTTRNDFPELLAPLKA